MKSSLLLIAKILFIIAVLAAAGFYLAASIWGAVVAPIAAAVVFFYIKSIVRAIKLKRLEKSLGAAALIRTATDGTVYRDLNKNGKLDIYEDASQPVEKRVEDLLSQMTLEEKAGLMFSPMMGNAHPDKLKKGGNISGPDSVLEVIAGKNINTFACMDTSDPVSIAKWYNACQGLAERTRLGIPLTFCSDPRHHFLNASNPFASLTAAGVSAWPTSLGLAAMRDEKAVEEFGAIARQELRALGIRFGLHPTADTATEPRWPRIQETYGEDAELNGRLSAAYIRGAQGESINQDSVACCIKHFPGGGPQKDGEDPHCSFGKDQVYPGNNFDYHLAPFAEAFKAGVTAAMPHYGRPIGLESIEEVGFNYNKQITHELLREKMGFEGIVHTDYGILTDAKVMGTTIIPARAWGVEHLSVPQRLEKAIDAGVDQIGGEAQPALLVRLVQSGKVGEGRVNESCRRILSLKFRLGLFDAPFVNPEKAVEVCGKREFVEAGEAAMRRSLVLLKNGFNGMQTLPLFGKPKVYVEGFNKKNVAAFATCVDSPAKADFALIHQDFPSQLDTREALAFIFKGGPLEYTKKQQKHLLKIMETCPTIVCIKMLRPAAIPEIAQHAAAILCEFGAKERILLEAIFGAFTPNGKLPFELPRSMDAVRVQKSDVSCDSKDPLYPFGFGLTY